MAGLISHPELIKYAQLWLKKPYKNTQPFGHSACKVIIPELVTAAEEYLFQLRKLARAVLPGLPPEKITSGEDLAQYAAWVQSCIWSQGFPAMKPRIEKFIADVRNFGYDLEDAKKIVKPSTKKLKTRKAVK